MKSYFLLSTLSLILISNSVMAANARIRANKPLGKGLDSFEYLEIVPLPLVLQPARVADRTLDVPREERDSQNLIKLFNNAKHEAKDGEELLSEMVKVLRKLLARKPGQKHNHVNLKSPEMNPIAWAYYDDFDQ